MPSNRVAEGTATVIGGRRDTQGHMDDRSATMRPPGIRTSSAVAAAIVLITAALGACGGSDQEHERTSVPTPLKAGRQMRLDVLVFNVE